MIILSPKLQIKYFLDFRKFLINSTESEIMLNLWHLGNLLHKIMGGLITYVKSVTLLYIYNICNLYITLGIKVVTL